MTDIILNRITSIQFNNNLEIVYISGIDTDKETYITYWLNIPVLYSLFIWKGLG